MIHVARIEAFDAAAARMFSDSEAGVMGKNVSMLMPETDRGNHDGYIRHYLETGDKKFIGIGRAVNGQRSDGRVFPSICLPVTSESMVKRTSPAFFLI